MAILKLLIACIRIYRSYQCSGQKVFGFTPEQLAEIRTLQERRRLRKRRIEEGGARGNHTAMHCFYTSTNGSDDGLKSRK